jgi:hypothetical protein
MRPRSLVGFLAASLVGVLGCSVDAEEGAGISDQHFETVYDGTKTYFSPTEVLVLSKFKADAGELGAFRTEIDALAAGKGPKRISTSYDALAKRVQDHIDDADGKSEFGPVSDTSPVRKNLAPEERAAIFIYTTDELFAEMNSALRDAAKECESRFERGVCPETAYEKLRPFQHTIKVLSSGLNKLPPFRDDGKVPTVHRGSNHTDGYTKGATVTESAFISTSANSLGDNFQRKGRFEIRVHDCPLIAELSSVGIGEAEVLCAPGNRFKVTDRREADGVVSIKETQL